MKTKLITIIVALIAFGVNAAGIPSTDFSTNQVLKIRWTHSNELSPDLAFILFTTTNLVGTNTIWTATTNISGMLTNCAVSVKPGQMYFRLIASNFWGCSDPSNVLPLPPVPSVPQTTVIYKEP